jgi:hypothetical protein
METSMTKTAKTATEKVEDVVEAVTAATSKMEIPAAARDFVERAAKSVQEGADSLNARAHEATSAIETAIGGSATTVADAARKVQDAIYEDVKSALAAVEKLSKSANLAEAAQVQIDYLSERGQVQIARMKSATESFVKALQDGAKSTQDTVAKWTAKGSKAA